MFRITKIVLLKICCKNIICNVIIKQYQKDQSVEIF